MQLIGIIISIVLSSLYVFPFEFSFFLGVNTKMMLAVLGLIILGFKLASGEPGRINHNFLQLSLLAIVVSLIAFTAVTINHTNERAYVTYIVSMWVWLSGAYAVVNIIKAVHGSISIILIGNYLLAVAVMQCFFGLLNENVEAFNSFTNNLVGDMGFMKNLADLEQAGRIYGIGAALDVAGTRFAAILALSSVVVCKIQNTKLQKYLIVYLLAFIFVAVIANMISRTTIVGVALAIVYWIYILVRGDNKSQNHVKTILKYLTVAMVICLPIIIYLYKTDANFYHNLRFGFEGFFSLVEKGRWESHSNDILLNMYKLPESLHTWLIGDGYFDNPLSDPYYIGYQWKGFYMGTDVGYLRFLFYFGILGLLAFSIYIVKVALVCINEFGTYSDLFILLLLVNFTVWCKVSTDIFVVFAPFLCLSAAENDEWLSKVEAPAEVA